MLRWSNLEISRLAKRRSTAEREAIAEFHNRNAAIPSPREVAIIKVIIDTWSNNERDTLKRRKKTGTDWCCCELGRKCPVEFAMTDIDERTAANMEVVLDEACRDPPNGGNHEVRKTIATKLLLAVRTEKPKLENLRAVARQALNDCEQKAG